MDIPTCRRCQGHGPFYKAYMDHHNYVCKACASALVQETRRVDPARLLAYRWYNTLQRRGVPCERTGEAAAAVLKQWGLASVISGETDAEKLCIFPFFRNVPPQEAWHCVVVSQKEARSLSHLQSEERIHALFPLHVRQYMAAAASTRTLKTS